ncbi:MAG: ATP-dependent RecD-like DNA helicase [Clostridia bacterium]|nr:ATP-dependent RecD-like DNA helicase [Clostridia bacterium]
MDYLQNDDNTELRGSVEGIVFRNEDNGFTVLELNSGDELETVVGVLPCVSPGEELRLLGKWDFHASFGRQFKATLCERRLPSTSADLKVYLSSGAIKGIGPATALKIVEAFGEDSFNVLENDPKRLSTIKGISLKKANEICESFKQQFAVREVMIALEKFGMTSSECVRVYKMFGNLSVDIVKSNPYKLCAVNGISFDRADTIAHAMDENPDVLMRSAAGIVHVVKHNIANGHTCLPTEKLLPLCASFLDITEEQASAVLDDLVCNFSLVREEIDGRYFIFLPQMYEAERSAADLIKQKLQFPPAGRNTLEEEISAAEKKESVVYESKQRLAIRTAAEKGLLILTGGPGTGKTTALKGILNLYEEQGLDVVLTAPTGRAAKRMSEVTGREAKTIHRLLEVEWDESDRPYFQRNERNPIEASAVIVDELSMVDIYVFSSLIKALPLGCRLIMVGDSDQLPPVGAGNVLHDLIESGLLPVVALTEVFRQASESLIITNAHRIVKGDMPDLHCKNKDFFYMERTTYAATQTIVSLCSDRLPKAYGYSAIDDIQVLCPSRKGETGSANINRLLQEKLNPPSKGKREIRIKGHILREGDKVMQVKNNYDIIWDKDDENGTGVYNGDIGILEWINHETGCLCVVFDGRYATYTFEQAQDIELAYAITVHKSQGSEFPAVIVPVVGIVPQLSYRNLLYTAVTRAKGLLILVGQEGQIREMTMNDKKAKRYSALRAFLND